MPAEDWKSTTLGSKDVYRQLQAVRGLGLVEIAFFEIHKRRLGLKNPNISDSVGRFETGTHADLVLSVIIHAGYAFKPENCEPRGIHCLNWATQWSMITEAHHLLKYYAHLCTDRKYDDILHVIMRSAIAGRYLEKMPPLPFPKHVKDAALQAGNISNIYEECAI